MLQSLLENSVFKKIVNTPVIWNTLEAIVGANRWKLRLYPSVFAKSGRLLDFGCSMGNITPGFLSFEYVGVDIDCRLIEAARRRFKKYPNISFECVDILNATFRPAPFEYVLCATTGHHLTDQELEPIIMKLLALLKPGGELHFFDIVRRPGQDPLTTRLLTRVDQGKHIRTEGEYRRLFDPRRYRIAERKLFESPRGIVKQQAMLYFKFIA